MPRRIKKADLISKSTLKIITPLYGISIAPLAQISIYVYIIFFVRFRSHFTCEYRLPLVANIEPLCGISIALKEQISIYINIPSSTVAATTVPLLHKDCSFGRNRAKVGIGMLSTFRHEDGEGLQRRATGR